MDKKTEMFHKTDFGDGIIRIESTGSVYCYLVLGTEKALLIDTLTGLGNLNEYVGTITGLPVMVVNTHGHLDHIGGDFDFDEVFMPSADEELFYQNSSREERYAFEVKNAEDNGQDFSYKQGGFSEEREIVIRHIEDGDEIDLDGRVLTCIAIPGHTVGSCAFLDGMTGILFSGDCGNSRTFLFMKESVPVKEYYDSLIRLKKLYGSRIKKWYQFHAQTNVPVEILDNLLECCELILDHRETGPDFVFDFSGYKELKAKSAMLLQRQGLYQGAFEQASGKLSEEEFEKYAVCDDNTVYGDLKSLGPVIRMSETMPKWSRTTPQPGSSEPKWEERL